MNNSILFNIAGLAIQNNLSYANSQMSCTLERMSSGLKVNHAKDGAAECSISTKITSKLSGLNTASDNIAHGQNMLLEMDSALENMLDKVNQIQALALEASNTAYSEEERMAIQDQIDQLRKEVYRERDIATYSDNKIFEPDPDNEIKPYSYEVEYIESKSGQYIKTGVVANENTKVNLKMQCVGGQTAANFFGARPYGAGSTDAFVITSYSSSKKIGFFYNDTSIPCINYDNEIHTYELGGGVAKVDGVDYGLVEKGPFTTKFELTLFGNANGGSQLTTRQRVYATKIYDGDKLIRDYIPVVDHDGKTALYDKVNDELVYDETGKDFVAGPVVVPPPPTMRTITLQVGSEAGVDNTIGVELNVEFGTLTGSVLNEEDSKILSKCAKEFADKIILSRIQVGAGLNRIESIAKLHDNDIVNLSSTKSSLVDADIAQEASNHARNQILQQISTSLFTQANSMNGSLAQRLLMGI